MKTSNIIITSLIGVLALLILTAAIELRFFGEKGEYFSSRYTVDSVAIDNYKHLVVEGFRSRPELYISNSNYIKISAVHETGETSPDEINITTLIHNDTLYINSPQESVSFNFTLSTPDTLESLLLKNTYFEVNGVPVKKYVTYNSRLEINGTENSFRTNINGMNKSRININQINDTIIFQLNNSNLSINRMVNSISGQMQQSFLRINKVNHLTIDKDTESKLDIR